MRNPAAGAQVLGVLAAPRPDDGAAVAAPEIPAGPEPTAAERYELAYGLLQQFRTDEAEFAFNEFLALHPDHELAANAHYWLGETYYSRQMYGDAALTFFAAYNAAPTGAKAPDNFLKLGMSLARMEQKTEACAVLVELPQRFPNAGETVRSQAAAERTRLSCP